MLKNVNCVSLVLLFNVVPVAISHSQTIQLPDVVYEFSSPTIEMNGWNIIPGGFENRPAGSISVASSIRSFIASSFDNSGLVITVNPGEVVFAYSTAPIISNTPSLLRMIVRSQGAHASIALVALDGDLSKGQSDGSMGYIIPQSSESFSQTEKSLNVLYQPKTADGFTLCFQIASTSETVGTQLFIDRIEVYSLVDSSQLSGQLMDMNYVTPYRQSILEPSPSPTSSQPAPSPSDTPANSNPAAFHETEPNNTIQNAQYLTEFQLNQSYEYSGTLDSGDSTMINIPVIMTCFNSTYLNRWIFH